MTEVFREHRVAITTYRRHPYQAWDADEFVSTSVPLAHGNQQDMLLTSRPFGKDNSGLREIRRLTTRGNQTAIVTSNCVTPIARVAGSMFSRWCQENYFRYASHHWPQANRAELAKPIAGAKPRGPEARASSLELIDLRAIPWMLLLSPRPWSTRPGDRLTPTSAVYDPTSPGAMRNEALSLCP